MDLYSQTSYELSRRLTQRYSTSFSLSSRLFTSDIQPHIYAIYGLVRIADEIVDTYRGKDAATLLDELEHDTERAIRTGYSPNPIVHAFALSASTYGITTELTRPFFASMRVDLAPTTYTEDTYRDYIYGSAEVIGLMCLRVFTRNDTALYESLAPGARALGAAYQKVNFLRDIRDDHKRLGRVYFPGVQFDSFSNQQKQTIEADIEHDFTAALSAITKLPKGIRPALMMSYEYYYALFSKLKRADVQDLKTSRIRVANSHKLLLLTRRVVLR